jgi:hypothetical protein
MAATETQTQTQATEDEKASRYLIFVRLTDEFGEKDVWQEMGVVEADGASAARMEAIKRYDLMAQARTGDLEIASVGERFWATKRPTVKTQETIDGV